MFRSAAASEPAPAGEPGMWSERDVQSDRGVRGEPGEREDVRSARDVQVGRSDRSVRSERSVRRPSRGELARGMGWVTAGSMLANILGYLLHIAATNLLGPAGYGQFAALMAVQVVAAVPALAVQTVVARERATGTAVAGARRLVWHTGGVVSVVALLVGLALTAYFAHWSGWVTLSALLAVPVLVGLAGEQGILQGEQRFAALAAVVALAGVGKVGPAVLVLWRTGSVGWSFVASAVGYALVWAVARVLAGRAPSPSTSGSAAAGVSLSAVWWATQVQLLIMVFAQIDVVLAQRVLTHTDAGLYAAGGIFTKIAFWLPAAVALVFYPQLADAQARRGALRRALGLLWGVGAVVVVGTEVVSRWVPLVLGERFAPVTGLLWLFALLGVLLSVLQVLLVGAIAVEGERFTLVVWPLLVAEVVIVLAAIRTPVGLLGTAVGCVAAALVVVGATEWRRAVRAGRLAPGSDIGWSCEGESACGGDAASGPRLRRHRH